MRAGHMSVPLQGQTGARQNDLGLSVVISWPRGCEGFYPSIVAAMSFKALGYNFYTRPIKFTVHPSPSSRTNSLSSDSLLANIPHISGLLSLALEVQAIK